MPGLGGPEHELLLKLCGYFFKDEGIVYVNLGPRPVDAAFSFDGTRWIGIEVLWKNISAFRVRQKVTRICEACGGLAGSAIILCDTRTRVLEIAVSEGLEAKERDVLDQLCLSLRMKVFNIFAEAMGFVEFNELFNFDELSDSLSTKDERANRLPG